jgi:hypothetical protein
LPAVCGGRADDRSRSLFSPTASEARERTLGSASIKKMPPLLQPTKHIHKRGSRNRERDFPQQPPSLRISSSLSFKCQMSITPMPKEAVVVVVQTACTFGRWKKGGCCCWSGTACGGGSLHAACRLRCLRKKRRVNRKLHGRPLVLCVVCTVAVFAISVLFGHHSNAPARMGGWPSA